MLEDITQWLCNPEYNSGIILYKKYAKNKTLLFFFEHKIYDLDRLISEIKKIEIPTTHTPEKTKEPEVISALYAAKNIAWKEGSNLHARLMEEPDKNNRHKMAKRIVELVVIVKDCWAKINRYNETGDYSFLVEKKQPEVKSDLFKLFNDRTLKLNYILKAKNELNKITNAEKKEKKATHLAVLESDLEHINNRLTYLNDYLIKNNI